MKKNKILAGLSALVMGATMMAGTAMSASAADVYTDLENPSTYVGDGVFFAYYSPQHNGNYTWTNAPYGMDDGSIDGDVEFTYNPGSTTCGTVSVNFKVATFTVYGNQYTGWITAIKTAAGTNLLNGCNVSADTATVGDSAGSAELAGCKIDCLNQNCDCNPCDCPTYYMDAVFIAGNGTQVVHTDMPVKFIID